MVIAVGDLMFLGMQDFNFTQVLLTFAQIYAFSAPPALTALVMVK